MVNLYKIKEKRCMNEVSFVLIPFTKIEENDILNSKHRCAID